MLINVRSDFCFGNLLVVSADKNSVCRYLIAALCIGVMFCMTQTVIAEPESAQITGAFTGRLRSEGVAAIGAGGRNAARQAALSDALRKVAAEAGTHAMADKLPGAVNVPQQNPDAQPAQQGSRYSIVREWESKGIFHISVSAEVVKGKFDVESATLVRVLNPKKKIVIIQFDVANTLHVDDINNIYDGLPVALASRLDASGDFLSSYTNRAIPIEANAQQREAIIQIAGETGAQIFISGRVVNAGISQKTRHIEVELSVYDGFTGTRLLSRRLDEQAEGVVMVGNNKPFGSSAFFETEFGKAISRLIDSAVKELQETSENVPFSAHIIRVEGKGVVLDAGSDSLLESGDILVAYANDARSPITGPNGSVLGTADRAADTITLTQVKPQFSIGELSEDAAKLGVRVGNIARLNFADQRDLAARQIAAQQFAKAQQEAKVEADRVKAEQAAQAEAARIAAEQAAQAEAARIKEEKTAKAQAAAKAKAAKLKTQQKTTRASAAQQARARALSARIEAARKAKAQSASKAIAAKLKDAQKAKAAQVKIGQKDQIQRDMQTADETKVQHPVKAGAVKEKAQQGAQTAPEAEAAHVEAKPPVTH